MIGKIYITCISLQIRVEGDIVQGEDEKEEGKILL